MLVETPQPKSMPVPKPKHPVNMQAASQTLKVYPYPSQGQTIFEYKYPSIAVDLYLEIYTTEGRMVEKIRLNGTEGLYLWDCNKSSSGNYVFKTTSNSKQLDGGILQITK